MGSKCCVFVNKSKIEMEIRVFQPPDRPDKFKKIIGLKAGEVKVLKISKLCCDDSIPTHLMIYADGVYTGATLFRPHIKEYAKILGYLDKNGVHLKGIRIKFPSFIK
ncbi:hypothetical protein ACS0TY_012176 [Phlomoides rotata]